METTNWYDMKNTPDGRIEDNLGLNQIHPRSQTEELIQKIKSTQVRKSITLYIYKINIQENYTTHVTYIKTVIHISIQ